MSENAPRRVGLEVGVTQDHLSNQLRSWASELQGLNRLVGRLNQAAGGVSHGRRPQGRINAAREEGRLAVTRERTEQRIRVIRAQADSKVLAAQHQEAAGLAKRQAEEQKLATVRAVSAQKERQEILKVQGLEQKHETQLQHLRMGNAQARYQNRQRHVQRIQQLEARGEEQRMYAARRLQGLNDQIQQRREAASRRELIEQQRLNQATLRTELLERRVNRLRVEGTADERKILELQERINAKMPRPGNYIGASQAIGQAGLRVAGGAIGLANSDDARAMVQAQTSLRQMGFSPAQNRQLLLAAQRMRSQTNGLDRADAINAIKDLVNITGDPNEAMNPALMRKFAGFIAGNRTAYHLSEAQSQAAIKAAEQMIPGFKRMSADQKIAAIGGKLDIVNKIMGGSAGRVQPSNLLAFEGRAGSAMTSLSTAGLYNLMPLAQEMGASQTGRALMSIDQNLAYGKTSTQAKLQMLRMGLLDRAKVHLDAIGHVKKVDPGALVDTKLLLVNPQSWVEKHLAGRFRNADSATIQQTLNGILTDRSASNLVTKMIMQRQRIHKDAANYQRALTVDQMEAAQRNNYLRAESNFTKELGALRGVAGVSMQRTLVPFLNQMTGSLKGLNDFFDHHPGMAQKVTALVAGGGIATAAGSVGYGGYQAFKTMRAIQAIASSGGVRAAGAEAEGAVENGLVQAAESGGVQAAAQGLGTRIGAVMTQRVGASMFATMPRALGSVGLVVGAAVAGWEIGQIIGRQKVGGRTIDDWLAQGMEPAVAAMEGLGQKPQQDHSSLAWRMRHRTHAIRPAYSPRVQSRWYGKESPFEMLTGRKAPAGASHQEQHFYISVPVQAGPMSIEQAHATTHTILSKLKDELPNQLASRKPHKALPWAAHHAP